MLVGNFVNLPRTNLGPLTKAFTPPAACQVNIAQCATCDRAWQGQFCGSSGFGDTTTCWPPVDPSIASPTAPFLGWGFYSPGIVCPGGYTTACSATKGPSGYSAAWDVEFSLTLGETAIGCCPTGYTCGNNFGNTCFITATSTTISTVMCVNGTNNLGFKTVPDQDVGINTYTLFAPMYQLNWQSSDRPDSSSAQQTSTSSAGSSSTPSPASSGTSGNIASQTSPPPAESTGGLSSGAAAGIGVGATVLVVAIVAAVFFLWRRKRKGAAAAPLLQPPGLEGYYGRYNTAPKSELSSDPHAYQLSHSPTTIRTEPVESPHAASPPVEMPSHPVDYRYQ
ncbi:hypothetical protein GQ53DRAFT_164843 [Thozetella sp. PMI_491]|nr:hypothetical protein GQ53DRAFT_164843 [Thozetella sp. PMI_491]